MGTATISSETHKSTVEAEPQTKIVDSTTDIGRIAILPRALDIISNKSVTTAKGTLGTTEFQVTNSPMDQQNMGYESRLEHHRKTTTMLE